MKRQGKIRLHREPGPEPGIKGKQTFSVEGPMAVLLPFFEREGEVRLSEIAMAVGDDYQGELMAGCTEVESVGGERSGRAVLKGYIVEPRYEISIDTKSKLPPTTEQPCPGCAGRGSVTAFDVEAMRAKRKAFGLTQTAVARAAGWQANVVSELESGARPMTRASAERYWKALEDAESEAAG